MGNEQNLLVVAFWRGDLRLLIFTQTGAGFFTEK
jgi:hypothetical protein